MCKHKKTHSDHKEETLKTFSEGIICISVSQSTFNCEISVITVHSAEGKMKHLTVVKMLSSIFDVRIYSETSTNE